MIDASDLVLFGPPALLGVGGWLWAYLSSKRAPAAAGDDSGHNYAPREASLSVMKARGMATVRVEWVPNERGDASDLEKLEAVTEMSAARAVLDTLFQNPSVSYKHGDLVAEAKEEFKRRSPFRPDTFDPYSVRMIRRIVGADFAPGLDENIHVDGEVIQNLDDASLAKIGLKRENGRIERVERVSLSSLGF